MESTGSTTRPSSEVITNPSGDVLAILRTEAPGWTSNAYLVADVARGHAILVDGNGLTEPLATRARELGVVVDAVVLTHWHVDHVAGLDAYRNLGPGGTAPPVLATAFTRDQLVGSVDVDRVISGGERLSFGGGIDVDVIDAPGHTAGQVTLLVNDADVFTADVIFRGCIGGTSGPDATSYGDHVASIERILELPPATRVHPGHTDPTTVEAELASNPFVRVRRGDDPEGAERVTVSGRAATLVVWARDYDGTYKAWVRYLDDGADAIVGGSRVARA